jgi:hypothetical protein
MKTPGSGSSARGDDWTRGPIKVDVDALAHSMVDRDLAAERYMACVRPTIEDPYEIWLSRETDAAGQVFDVKKYIGLYRMEGGERAGMVVYVVRERDGGWRMDHFLPVPEGEIDEHRCGTKLLYTRPSSQE